MASNGIAGEFYVAAQLTKLGMIATLTGKNTKDIDILAANPQTGKTCLIQVKEKANPSPEWKMAGQVKENQIKMNVWYVFVDLANYNCYIISAKELFPKLKARQENYNRGYKKNGEKRKPDPCFYFNMDYDCFDKNGNKKVNNWQDLPLFQGEE